MGAASRTQTISMFLGRGEVADTYQLFLTDRGTEICSRNFVIEVPDSESGVCPL